MLRDLTSSANYVEVKRAAEDREGWRAINRRGMPQTCYNGRTLKEVKPMTHAPETDARNWYQKTGARFRTQIFVPDAKFLAP